ncbi:hypothetical protein AAMO2058_001272900 [Amorphochlora amoebiformis]
MWFYKRKGNSDAEIERAEEEFEAKMRCLRELRSDDDDAQELSEDDLSMSGDCSSDKPKHFSPNNPKMIVQMRWMDLVDLVCSPGYEPKLIPRTSTICQAFSPCRRTCFFFPIS